MLPTAMLAIILADKTADGPKKVGLLRWGEKQIHLLLGDAGRSFVVGFGRNPPRSPHHRAASCNSPKCDIKSALPNPWILYGALVGGPALSGSYTDDRNNYVNNEVATDYNAGFQTAVAGLKSEALRKRRKREEQEMIKRNQKRKEREEKKRKQKEEEEKLKESSTEEKDGVKNSTSNFETNQNEDKINNFTSQTEESEEIIENSDDSDSDMKPDDQKNDTNAVEVDEKVTVKMSVFDSEPKTNDTIV